MSTYGACMCVCVCVCVCVRSRIEYDSSKNNSKCGDISSSSLLEEIYASRRFIYVLHATHDIILIKSPNKKK